MQPLTLWCPIFFTPFDVQRGGGKITPPHMYLEFWGTYDRNSNSYTHVFEVKLFNAANSYVTGSRYVTGNRYGVWQTGNNNISRPGQLDK